MNDVRTIITSYLAEYPPSLRLFNLLEQAGDLYLIGGVLREYRDYQDIRSLRDLDMVIDIRNDECWRNILDEFQPDKNSFGGYKLYCTGLVVDIWSLDESWAYREQIVSCIPQDYVKNLTRTVFLNLDAIVYDIKRNIWYDDLYQKAMQTHEIDVVLEKNPQVLLNIVRAMVLKERYQMKYSSKLREIILRESGKEDFIENVLEIQRKRYRKLLLSKEEIEAEIQKLSVCC